MAATALTDRHYDIEVRLTDRVPEDQLSAAISASGAVQQLEIWGVESASVASAGRLNVMRTYPDRGHGSFSLVGAPEDTSLVTYPIVEGRWLKPDDTDAIVLTSQAHRGSASEVGDAFTVSIDGEPRDFTIVGIVREVGGGGAYLTKATLDQVTGGRAGQQLRVKFDPETNPATALQSFESALAEADIGVERAFGIETLYGALVGHVEVPVTMLVSAAVLLATIGGLGLASMMTISVVERTREIGVIKSIGAVPAMIVRLIVAEGAAVVALSWIASIILALPLIYGIDQLGSSMFGMPLPFTVSPVGSATWFGLVAILSLVASAAPAWRASRLVVREALAYT